MRKILILALLLVSFATFLVPVYSRSRSDSNLYEELNTETFDYYEPREDIKRCFSKEPVHWIVKYHKDGTLYHYFKYLVLENGEIVEESLETGLIFEEPKEYFSAKGIIKTALKEQKFEDSRQEGIAILLSIILTIAIISILWKKMWD